MACTEVFSRALSRSIHPLNSNLGFQSSTDNFAGRVRRRREVVEGGGAGRSEYCEDREKRAADLNSAALLYPDHTLPFFGYRSRSAWEKIEKTIPTAAFGSTIDASQESKTEILVVLRQ